MIDKKKLREKVNHLKLLYVEDEAPLREQGEIFFKKFFSQVRVASNGKDGLELFKSDPCDIIISDIKMPKMYGDEMLYKMIHEAEKIQKPIFTTILTATIDDNDNDNKIDDKIDDKIDYFFLKPIEFEQMFELLTKIEKKFKL
ncbi:MAG: response regulator [Gammaproteobacteria bacterium]|nr:response regulator [Gammaproteobacteria bacterium]